MVLAHKTMLHPSTHHDEGNLHCSLQVASASVAYLLLC